MHLCRFNPQLLSHDWAMELVQRLRGKISKGGWTALTILFDGNPENTDFNSNVFKLLWDIEKYINVKKLKELMRMKPDLKDKVVNAIPEAVEYYDEP